MPLNTIYQVRHRQRWDAGGKFLESVYFFDHTAGAGNWADLAASFGTVYGAAVNDLQTNNVNNYSIDVINLGDLGDFGFLPQLGVGDYVAESLPPHSALNFTMKVNTRAVRKGSKRISGIPETVQNGGHIGDATYLGRMEDFRLILQTELVSAGDTWLPVVVKRVKTAVVGTVPLQYTYRLPETDAELVVGEIVVALTTSNISHQVSREV